MGNIEWLAVKDLPTEKVGEDGVLAWFYGEPAIAYPVDDHKGGIGWWIGGERYTTDQPTAWAEINPPA